MKTDLAQHCTTEQLHYGLKMTLLVQLQYDPKYLSIVAVGGLVASWMAQVSVVELVAALSVAANLSALGEQTHSAMRLR